MKKKGLTSKQKKQIIIGGFVAAAALGITGILYYLSTRAVGEGLVAGKTYYFDYIPGTTNQRNFIVPAGFPYSKASDIVMSLEGGLGEDTNTKINSISRWNSSLGQWDARYYYHSFPANQWAADDFSLTEGTIILITYTSSFSWTP